jgi:flagellar biosynthesis/type III secretory pathway protein FliH
MSSHNGPLRAELAWRAARLVKARDAAAWLEARRVLEEAEERAAHLIRAAEADADRIRQAAQEEASVARRDGFEHGRREACEHWTALQAEITQQVARELQQSQAPLVSLAIAIARKILDSELRVDPQLVERSVAAVLQGVAREPFISLYVHPDDVAILQTSGTWRTGVMQDCDIRVLPDASLPRAGCRVVCQWGELDGRFDAQLRQIEKALLTSVS